MTIEPSTNQVAALSRALFKGAAYPAIILFDVAAAAAIIQYFDQMTPGTWFAVAVLLWANVMMFAKVFRVGFIAIGIIIGIVAIVILLYAAHALLPAWTGIAFAIGMVVFLLFQKLDAINANIAESNRLKRRELDENRR